MRTLKTILLAAAALWLPAAHAADDLSVSAIPAPLLVNAHVVKRLDEQRFEVRSQREATLYKHYIITVLDEQGKRSAIFQEAYNRLIKIGEVEGALYDAQGKLQRRMKGRDLMDFSAVSDNNLMDDTRMKAHRFEYPTYPFTIEYEVTLKFNNTFLYPTWAPQDEEHLSVQKSSFTFVCPENYLYRFKAFRVPGEPALTQDNGNSVRTWVVSDVPAVERPFAAPLWRELTPMVYFAPNGFEIENYQGDASSWEGLGQFLSKLNVNRDVLPEDLKKKVHALTDGLSDPREKAKVLYEHLQRNTRYISIQMGLGGWQTFEAQFVASKGYGDCKALSNYMYSMLKEAGVPAFYTLVHAGRSISDRSMLDDFPSNQFNHVIVCVPFQKDSMWLECTSQSTPAGYMGTFTGNRKALLITNAGGKLVATPRYTWRENRQVRNASGTLDADGNLALLTRTEFQAEQQDNIHGLINGLSKERLKEYLNEELGMPSYEVNDFKYDTRPGTLPVVEERLDLTLRNYATITGKRLFITPNLANRSGRQLDDEARRYDIRLSSEYHDIDSVSIAIPAGYSPEVLPKPVQLSTPYGSYRSEVVVRDNKLLYVRECKAFAGLFPATQWEDVRKYYNSIYKADRQQVVLVKQ